jgi:GMP synthase (glutamine-hydrolysing)
MKLIEAAMNNHLPVLGICLGAQLIAKTLGANVYPNREKEIGWYDISPTGEAENDPLLAAFEKSEKIFQWHGETFDMPQSALHLAFSPLCANQAFRYGENVYGFQFHLEVDERMIRRWLRVGENRAEIAALGRAITAEKIHAETPTHIQRLHELSEQIFGEFIGLFGLEKRLHRLPLR